MSGELRVQWRFDDPFVVYAAAYFEGVANDFQSQGTPIRRPWNGEPLFYRSAQLGFGVDGAGQWTTNIYAAHEDPNGRGIDFVERYGHTFGGGVSFAF